MQIQFLGAAGEVTGSKHLLTLDRGKKILLDCGMFQGGTLEDEYFRNEHLGFDPREVDYVVLSHAHIDHSGLIPRLGKEGFKGVIYCTPQTKDLCDLMLNDSANIQENDTEEINKARSQAGKDLVKPLYGEKDVQFILDRFVTIPYNRPLVIDDEVELLLTDVGHILGSSAVHLTLHERDDAFQLTFTGDIGRKEDPVLRPPQPFPQADVLITESTYGNKIHGNSFKELPGKLAAAIERACVQKGGKLIIPAFSLDRTQDIVYMLDQLNNEGLLPNVKFFVDSPLATRVTEVMRDHTSCFNDDMLRYMGDNPHPFRFENLEYTENVEASKALNEMEEPAVIITASGMMEGGRIKHHLIHHIEEPDTTILMVGYSTPASLGGQIQNGAEEVFIFGRPYQVKAEVQYIDGFSAHADSAEMLEYVSCQDPSELSHIFLVHGEGEALTSMKNHYLKAGYESVSIPDYGDVYELIKTEDQRLVIEAVNQ